VSLFWIAPWKTSNLLFFCMRYLPFATSGVVLYYYFWPTANQETCLIAYEFLSWMILVCLCLSEAILTIRTWAVWERNRILGILLSLFFVTIWTCVFIVLQRSMDKVRYVSTTLFPNGCIVAVTGLHDYIIVWSLLMGFQLGTFILMSIKGYQSFKHSQLSNSELYRVIYVNGILYYIYLFALTAINLIIPLVLSHDSSPFFRHIMQSLLTCRMLFELRQQGKHASGDPFLEYNSSVSIPLDTVIFRKADRVVSYTSREGDFA